MAGSDRARTGGAAGAGFEAVPLSDAIGVEVRGVTLQGTMDDHAVAALRQAWLDHAVVLLRGQTLDDGVLVELTRRFGEIEVPPPLEYGTPYIPGHPEVMVISNVEQGGRPIGSLGAGEAVWHSDLNFTEAPPAASLLYAIEVPPAGGETGFASMTRAFAELPRDLAKAIEGRRIRHDARFNSAGQPRLEQRPPVEHPIVRTHPETGRKCLYLGRRAHASIAGLPEGESEALLDALWAHAVQDRFVWYQHWRPGDLVIWDNRCTMHRRNGFDPAARRILHRTQTLGSRPY